MQHIESGIGPATHALIRVDLGASGIGVVKISPGKDMNPLHAVRFQLRDEVIETIRPIILFGSRHGFLHYVSPPC